MLTFVEEMGIAVYLETVNEDVLYPFFSYIVTQLWEVMKPFIENKRRKIVKRLMTKKKAREPKDELWGFAEWLANRWSDRMRKQRKK